MTVEERINTTEIPELELVKTWKLSVAEKLSIVCHEGNASKYFSEGDTIEINGITFEICAFNHYVNSDNRPCGITFVSSGLVGKYKMNPTDTNKGGYFDSQLREDLLDLFHTFPKEWQSVIKKSRIVDTDENGNIIHHYDYLFIPSAYEIFGDHIKNINIGMGTWPDYYKKYGSIYKQEGTPIPYLYSHRVKGDQYWTRSAYLSICGDFWYVGSILDFTYAYYSFGVALCFSI